MGAVEGTTRVVGIFGDPVHHSLSPRMHNAAFVALGLDYVYVPLRPTARTIGEAVGAIRALGLVGVNVTVPFKQEVIEHLDSLSDEARAVGAVNTIVAGEGGCLAGANTDVEGFAGALRARGVRLRGKRALLIGAGGAARAVVQSLVAGGAADVVIANRTLARARSLAADFDAGTLRARGLDALEDADLLADRNVVINSTSVGLKGAALPGYSIEATAMDCVHFDLAYGEKPTAFVAAAERAGRPAIDGRYMLLYQGIAAFKLFTGRKAPADVMARAIGIVG
ncbi:MAG: shikimate dehydrogenase [Myxococcales bacterium]|jgi:shikimate dehydrogenase|nr:MAG: shikimate dehydrogenase [Myxococcales bacterium]